MKFISYISLIKMMLKNSYDFSAYIDENTGKINKKSVKVLMLGFISFAVVYFTYEMFNELKKYGLQGNILSVILIILQLLIVVQLLIIVPNFLIFSDDNQKYIYMPISGKKMALVRTAIIFIIIMLQEFALIIPSTILYGIRTVKPLIFYLIMLIVFAVVTLLYVFIISGVTIIVSQICKFIKNKKIYKKTIVFIMTMLILFGFCVVYKAKLENIENIVISREVKKSEFGVTTLCINILNFEKSEMLSSIIRLLGMVLISYLIYNVICRKFYLKIIVNQNSMFSDKKKNKKKKKIIRKNKYYSYILNEFRKIRRSSILFSNYIYKMIICLVIINGFVTLMSQAATELIENNELASDTFNYEFDFEVFSIIEGIIQSVLIINSISLTAFSRYGKNATFFKSIPISARKQIYMKLLPGILINSIAIFCITETSKNLLPGVSEKYFLLIFFVAMLLSIIDSFILILIDLWKPQLNFENEISIVKQNDNNIFKYALLVASCMIIAYLYQIMKDINLDLAILIESAILFIIILILNVIVIMKNEKLLKNIF